VPRIVNDSSNDARVSPAHRAWVNFYEQRRVNSRER
jgi:hypothetical protein